jgi:phage protein D
MSEAALSSLAVYTARPTVRVAGREDRRLSELVIGLEMRESEGGMTALELRLSNVASLTDATAELAFEDEEIVALGSELAVYGGDENAPQEIFSGVVTGLEAEFPRNAPPELVLLAEDGLQRARMTRRTAVHNDLSIASFAREVASDLGLTPRITGFTATLGTWVQLNESDLSFLRRLLLRHDGDVQVVGSELHVSPRGDVRRGDELELHLYSQLREVRIVADLADQVTKTTVTGWDLAQGRRVRAESRGSQPGPGTGRRGDQILLEALGEERDEHLGELAAATQEEAQALADAAFDRRLRRFVRVEGTAEGNPALRVGTWVKLQGISRRFDNTYYVTSACHRWDVTEGYATDFEAECASLGVAG